MPPISPAGSRQSSAQWRAGWSRRTRRRASRKYWNPGPAWPRRRRRTAARRAADEAPAIWNRMQLRACVAIADGVREISEEGGEVDNQVPPLCLLIIRLGRMALLQLAKIDDHAEQILAAEAFV